MNKTEIEIGIGALINELETDRIGVIVAISRLNPEEIGNLDIYLGNEYEFRRQINHLKELL